MKAFKSLYRVKNLAIGTALSILALSQTSCLHETEPGQGCNQPFELVIHPASIQGNSHLYIDPRQLDVLNDPKVVVQDAYLEITLQGRHHRTQDLTLSLNGIKISRRDGGSLCEDLRADKILDRSKSKFPMHKMFLNGALPFHLFIAKLKSNRGLLKLSILGRDVRVLEARMVVKGLKPAASTGNGESCSPGGDDVPIEKPSVIRITSMSPSEPLTNSTNMQIAFSADRNGEVFYCSLDGQTAELCQSPKLYSNLANGNHLFSVYAKSPKGLQSNTVQYQWTVDSQPPTAVITNARSLPVLTNANSVSFEFAGNENGRLVCSLDGAAFVDCASPYLLTNLTEGTHSFAVNVIDQAGNTGLQPARFEWTIDRTPPTVQFVRIEPSASINNVSTKSFHFAASETSTSECSIDNGVFAPCASPIDLDQLGEGRHWFEVRATDLAGNAGPSSTYAWTVDLTAPVLRVLSATPNPGLSGARSLSVAFAASEEVSLQCRFDDEASAPCASPFARGELAEGPHTLVLAARDLAGNSAQEITLNWTLDFTSPQISFAQIDPATPSIKQSRLTAVVNASETSVLEVTLNGATIGQKSSPVILSDLQEGSYVLIVESVDSVGNRSNTLRHEFTVDLTAPTITSLLPSDTREMVNLDYRSFTFSTNESNVEFQCQLDEAGYEACASPASLSGLADGAHVFSVRAVDSAGNVGQEATHRWTIDTRPPQVTISAVQDGAAIEFTLSADENPVRWECGLDTEEFAPCSTSVVYSNLSAGIHKFRARAIDYAGNQLMGGATYTFEVALPVKTYLTSVSPDRPLTNQRSFTAMFSSNLADATFLCAIDGTTPAPCTSPYNIGNLADGVHTFFVTAVDSRGTADSLGATYSWTVDGTAPSVPSLSLSVTSTSITVTWSTSEQSSSQILWGVGTNLDRLSPEDTTLKTSHQIRLDGLSANTVYSVQVTGKDNAGNVYLSAPRQIRTSR